MLMTLPKINFFLKTSKSAENFYLMCQIEKVRYYEKYYISTSLRSQFFQYFFENEHFIFIFASFYMF